MNKVKVLEIANSNEFKETEYCFLQISNSIFISLNDGELSTLKEIPIYEVEEILLIFEPEHAPIFALKNTESGIIKYYKHIETLNNVESYNLMKQIKKHINKTDVFVNKVYEFLEETNVSYKWKGLMVNILSLLVLIQLDKNFIKEVKEVIKEFIIYKG